MFRWMPLLLALMGVIETRHNSHHDNDGIVRPIIKASDQERICADLCSSGLGGEPCGDVCFDLIPRGMPSQSPKGGKQVKSVRSRNDVCPLLCKYRLGYPLCSCPTTTFDTISQNATVARGRDAINFHEICAFYCIQQNWCLHGCPPCSNSKGKQNGRTQDGVIIKPWGPTMSTYQTPDIDWEQWCNIQCANSNGGSACNCDILPFNYNAK